MDENWTQNGAQKVVGSIWWKILHKFFFQFFFSKKFISKNSGFLKVLEKSNFFSDFHFGKSIFLGKFFIIKFGFCFEFGFLRPKVIIFLFYFSLKNLKKFFKLSSDTRSNVPREYNRTSEYAGTAHLDGVLDPRTKSKSGSSIQKSFPVENDFQQILAQK